MKSKAERRWDPHLQVWRIRCRGPCERFLPQNMFHRDPKARTGRNARCRVCRAHQRRRRR